MGDDRDTTIKIRRDAKVGTDSRGRTVWTAPVDTVELELVSTQMLEQLLSQDDESQTAQLKALADVDSGYLARDTHSNEFGIVSDEELAAALGPATAAPEADRRPAATRHEAAVSVEPEEPEALVSTQVLRKMFVLEEEDQNADPEEGPGTGGFDPYDRG